MAQTLTPPTTVSEALMLEVRAEAGRRGITQTALARMLGRSQQAISDRWRGRTPWTVNEAVQLDGLFGLPAGSLLAAAVAAASAGEEPGPPRAAYPRGGQATLQTSD